MTPSIDVPRAGSHPARLLTGLSRAQERRLGSLWLEDWGLRVVARCASAAQLLEETRRGEADVALVDEDLHRFDSGHRAAVWQAGTPLVALVREPTDARWRDAPGLLLPLDAELPVVLDALGRAAGGERQSQTGRPGGEIRESTTATTVAPGHEAPPARLQVLAFWGGRGHAGSTLLATSSAAILGSAATTVLVDLDTTGAAVGVQLDDGQQGRVRSSMADLLNGALDSHEAWQHQLERALQPLGPYSRHGQVLCGLPRAIAWRFYGDGERETRLFDANVGRMQADGRALTRHGVIYAGWVLCVPEPTQGIEADAGEWWYTVQVGDTLSGISARLLGDPDRWDDIFQLNRGARAPDGHVLLDPNMIWPGLRLQLPLDEPAVSSDEPPAQPVPAPPATPTSVSERTEVAPMNAAPEPEPATPTPELPEVPAPRAAPPPADTGAADSVAKPAIASWPEFPLPADRVAELAAAAGLSVAVLAALRARRRPSQLLAPESDTRRDAYAFTLAEPAAVVAARRSGGDDPHGIVVGELLAGELVRRARLAGVPNVQVVSVGVGRTRSQAVLAAPLADRALLEVGLRDGPSLARRMEVTRSTDQDVVVRLEGIRRAALARTPPQDAPVLLCIGLQPDSRACLVGWNALGSLLIATPPATTDAQEHLAALVATLAGQCSPEDLSLYSITGANTLLGRLGRLPHQRALVDPKDPDSIGGLLARLRSELDDRRRADKLEGASQLAIAVCELADVAPYDDFVYVLTHGHKYGIRVLAATADNAVVCGPLVDLFESRFAFGLEDEEASIRLLGKPWALTLAEPGRLLAQVGRRKEIEILGLHLTEAGLVDLLAEVGVDKTGAAPAGTVDVIPHAGGGGGGGRDEELAAARQDDGSVDGGSNLRPLVEPHSVDPQSEPADRACALFTATVGVAAAETPVETDPIRLDVRSERNGHAVRTPTMEPAEVPDRITLLLRRAPLVIDCEQGSVWSPMGRLTLEQSSLLELLPYLGAAALLEQGLLDRWPGVNPDIVLEEVWAPRARDRSNRESGQTWLRKSLRRLQEELSRAAGGVAGDLVVEQDGALRLNQCFALSDVEAFVAAVERVRAVRGVEQITAAEEALVLRVADLLPHAPREQLVVGRKSKVYGWLDEPRWERAGARLRALGREVAGVLARAYRDAGRYEASFAVYAQLLGDDPLDEAAAEGLLMAAADMKVAPQLEEAWQQVLVCADGEVTPELRMLYERLRRKSAGWTQGAARATSGHYVESR